jgi:hypothetical protein
MYLGYVRLVSERLGNNKKLGMKFKNKTTLPYDNNNNVFFKSLIYKHVLFELEIN